MNAQVVVGETAGVEFALKRHEAFTPSSVARRRKSLRARKREARGWKRVREAEERWWGKE